MMTWKEWVGVAVIVVISAIICYAAISVKLEACSMMDMEQWECLLALW